MTLSYGSFEHVALLSFLAVITLITIFNLVVFIFHTLKMLCSHLELI